MSKKNIKKNTKYYGDVLFKDAIILLIISVAYFIFSMFVLHQARGLIIFLLELVVISQRKNEKSFGTYSLVASIVIIFLSIISNSAMGFAYILLGVFYLIHSINYRNTLK